MEPSLFDPNHSVELLSETPPEDLQRAQDYIRKGQFDDEVVAVFRHSEQNIQNAANSSLWDFALPCFWPQAIICSPILCLMRKNTLAILRGTIWVLGRRNLYKIVDVDRCCGTFIRDVDRCCGTLTNVVDVDRCLRDSGYCALKDVYSISVEYNRNSMAGLPSCCPTEILKVGLPIGCPIADGGKTSDKCVLHMLVEDPNHVSVLIREAAEAAEAAEATQQQAIQMQQMVMVKEIVAPLTRTVSGGGAGNRGEDIMTRMQNLKNMRDQALITETDYEMKKQDILATM